MNDHSKYLKQYREDYPEWVLYLAVNNLMSKAALRIRDDAWGLRNIPLRDGDKEFKKTIDKKMLSGMTWLNYGKVWHLTHPDLIEKIRNGMTKEELFKAEYFEPVFKTTNYIDKNNN